MKESISFIIPFYKAGKTINTCVDSIITAAEKLSSWEIIIVNNDPEGGEVTLNHNNSNITIIAEKRRGRSFARNTGARNSQGEWLVFVDADTSLRPLWVENLIPNAIKFNCVAGQGAIVPGHDYGKSSLNKFRFESIKDSTGGSFILTGKECFEAPMINSAACFYNREVFFKVGGFDTALPRHEDIDLSKRVFICCGDFYVDSDAIAIVEYHGKGWPDYIMRCFADGLTKVLYFQKWEVFVKVSLPPEKVIKNRDEVIEEVYKLNFFEKCIMVIKEAISLSSDLYRSPQFLTIISNFLFYINLIGKVVGLLLIKLSLYRYEGKKLFLVSRGPGRVFTKQRRSILEID